MQTGIEQIQAERERQVSAEGWTARHDDGHQRGELALAAVAYALPGGIAIDAGDNGYSVKVRINREGLWPFEHPLSSNGFNPGDRVRDLVKAGALLAAEVDRIQRSRGVPSEHIEIASWARHTIMSGQVVTFSTDFEGDGKFPNPKKALGPFEISASRECVIVHRCEVSLPGSARAFQKAFALALEKHNELRACNGRPAIAEGGAA